MAEGTRLLSEYGAKALSRVRIPPSPFLRKPWKRKVSAEATSPSTASARRVSTASVEAFWKHNAIWARFRSGWQAVREGLLDNRDSRLQGAPGASSC